MRRPLSILLIADIDIAKQLRAVIKLSEFQGSKVFAVKSIKDAPHRKFDFVITNLAEGISSLTALFDLYEKTPIIYVGENEKLGAQAIRKGAQDVLIYSELSPEHLTRILRHSQMREGIKTTLKERTFTDDLTGLYNRRGFFALAEQHMGLTKRTKHGFLLFLFDIDLFKKINDAYGHHVGDLALKDVAKCLKGAFRANDIVGRIGGDEFAVIALNCSPEAEDSLKEHLFHLIKKFNTGKKRPFHLSCSIGVAYYHGEHISLEALIEKADICLYRHKKKRHSVLLGREERM